MTGAWFDVYIDGVDIRDIIKSVRQRYPEYKWRKPKGKNPRKILKS